MELNLSYEQSKEILELGYDFSKVCWKSLYQYRDQYSLNQTFIKIHLHGTGLSLASIEDEIKCRMSKYGIVDLVTPIIPEAALLKCLPDLEEEPHIKNARLWLGKDLYLDSEDCIYLGDIDGDGVGYGSYELERLKDQEFKSGYEAFVWCHQHYPEELKAKFAKELKV